ncbi:MAG: hypothetical protein GY801_50570 [bacterium]|nr:hypothetical protein [bacterium]
MKMLLPFLLLLVFTMPVFAQKPFYRSAEHTLKKASNLETWQQQLRYYEQQLAEREQTVSGKIETSQYQYQQGMQQAAEREEVLLRKLQQQQEEARNQAFHTQLEQQQEGARQREAVLQRQLEAQQERAAYERLQQGMQSSKLQNLLQERQSQVSGQNTQQAQVYGYSNKQSPRNTQTQQTTSEPQVNLPAPPVTQPKPSTHILVFDAPTPVATIATLESKINTTVNGIDRIETRAILPETLSVEQLEAVKKITDNGALIAQQRLGLEQFQLDTSTQLSRLRVVKGFVLWGLLFSIPTLLTVYWIVRNIALGWRTWQQDTLEYKLKELESVERQLRMTDRQFDADHQR